jgi:hypothetical protein
MRVRIRFDSNPLGHGMARRKKAIGKAKWLSQEVPPR